jgi:soluble lytic murein transglycosylase
MKKPIHVTVLILTLGLSISSYVAAQKTSEGLSLSQRRKLFAEGAKLFHDKEYEKAVQYFEQLVEHYPKLHDYILFFLAKTYIKLEEHQKALIALQTFLSQYPSHPLIDDVRYNTADLLLADQKYNEAIELYLLLRGRPETDQGNLYYQLGKAFLGVEKYREAAFAFHQVISFHPDHPYIKEVRQYFQEILEKDPKLRPQWTEETLLEHANALLKAKFYESAITQYEAFKKRYPASVHIEECEFGIVDVYFRSGKAQKGMSTLEQLVTQYQTTHKEFAARALYTIGTKHWNADKNEQAKQYMLRITNDYAQTSWADDAYYVIGRIYQGENMYEEAANWYHALYKTYPKSNFAEESLWRAGWSYYLGQQYMQAELMFSHGIKVFPSGVYYDDSLYWLARTSEKRKNWQTAIKMYRQLVRDSPDTYYNILAQKRLRVFNITAETTQKETSPPPELSFLLKELQQAVQPAKYDEITWHLDKMLELQAVELQKYAAKEVEWIASLINGEKNSSILKNNLNQRLLFTYFLSRFYAFTGEYLKAIQLASKIESLLEQSDAQSFPYPLETLKYPLAYWNIIKKQAEETDLDPFLVAAIIRQESAYDPEALSYANAMGLMQIVPATGRRVARHVGLKNFKTSQLYDPEINIVLGTQYLADLLEQFEGNLHRALAAYNAGPKVTAKWWPEEKGGEQEVIVENITYRSTRNYVKRVLRNQHHYRLIYSELL